MNQKIGTTFAFCKSLAWIRTKTSQQIAAVLSNYTTSPFHTQIAVQVEDTAHLHSNFHLQIPI